MCQINSAKSFIWLNYKIDHKNPVNMGGTKEVYQ